MNSPAKIVSESLKLDDKMRSEVAAGRSRDGAIRQAAAGQKTSMLETGTLRTLASRTTVDDNVSYTVQQSDKLRELRDSVLRQTQKLMHGTTHMLGDSADEAERTLSQSLTRRHEEVSSGQSEQPQSSSDLLGKLATANAQVDFLRAELGRQQHLNVALERENQRLRTQQDTATGDTDLVYARLVELQAECSLARQAAADARSRADRLQAEVDDLTREAEDRAERALKEAKDKEARERNAAEGMPVYQAQAQLDGSRLSAQQALSLAGDVAQGGIITGGQPDRLGHEPPSLSGLRLPDEKLYRGIIVQLKKMVEEEGRKARLAQALLQKEREGRSAAVQLLVTAVEDAKKALDVKRRDLMKQGAAPPKPGQTKPGAAVPYDERQEVLAQVLSQEAVLTALQPVLFPHWPDGKPVTKKDVLGLKASLAQGLMQK